MDRQRTTTSPKCDKETKDPDTRNPWTTGTKSTHNPRHCEQPAVSPSRHSSTLHPLTCCHQRRIQHSCCPVCAPNTYEFLVQNHEDHHICKKRRRNVFPMNQLIICRACGGYACASLCVATNFTADDLLAQVFVHKGVRHSRQVMHD